MRIDSLVENLRLAKKNIHPDIIKLAAILNKRPNSDDLVEFGKVSIPSNFAYLCYNCKSIFDSMYNGCICPCCKSASTNPVAVAYRKSEGMSSPIIADVKQSTK